MPPSPSLTLILAATPSLGIGRAGTLPWPHLKKEMAYFARVTKRVPSASPARNAIIMGSKTWDSIPASLRPLKGRVNVVLTRDMAAFRQSRNIEQEAQEPLVAGSIRDALAGLAAAAETNSVHRVFVIGGASVYNEALKLREAERVLLTKVKGEWECDTFFGVDLEKDEQWRRAGRGEVEEWIGEAVAEEDVVEQGVGLEFCMFVRRGARA